MNLERLKRILELAKKPNKETKEHYKKLVEFGCVVCKREYGVYSTPCIHHITGGGMGRKSNSLTHTLPLCHEHHQGSEGIHHLGNKVWEEKYGSQEELLQYIKEKI